MTTQSITQGQEKQIARFIVDAAESAAKTVVQKAGLDKDGAQLVIERGNELNAIIAAAVSNALKQLSARYPQVTETRLLKPVSAAVVPARTKPFDADEFFQIRSGFYVWDSFRERVLPGHKPSDSAPERPYAASTLKENAYDRDIRWELPEHHLSTLEDIAALIEAQSGGKPGLLLTNGYANIFYVEGKNGEIFAVRVSWRSAARKWYALGYALDGHGYWGAGNQVLCPGNASL